MFRLTMFLVVVCLSLCFAVQTFAASAIKGKMLYKKICQSCHVQDGEGGIMGPADRKREEWKTFFYDDQHSIHPEAWKDLTLKKRKDLLLFFMNYAIDSEPPDECG